LLEQLVKNIDRGIPLGNPANASDGKHLQIVDFLQHQAREDDRIMTVDEATGALTFKRGRRTLDTISIPQWIGAALEMVSSLAKIDGFMLLDYIGHIKHVMGLAETYQWSQVRAYDDEYRRLQHRHRFRWGSQDWTVQDARIFHLHTPKFSTPHVRRMQTHAPICGKFNSPKPCTFTPCKYIHACRICGKSSHNALSCTSPLRTAADGAASGEAQ
jgi:hypothetical protein